jgi:hypothetical protein
MVFSKCCSVSTSCCWIQLSCQYLADLFSETLSVHHIKAGWLAQYIVDSCIAQYTALYLRVAQYIALFGY